MHDVERGSTRRTTMKSNHMKWIAAALTTTALGLGGGVANAAECQLRNIAFVSAVSDGRLVVNAELWDAVTGKQLGYLANSTYCKVNATYNGITAATCQAWLSTAMTAMLANKKIYITANACTPGNGVNLSSIGYFGLNN
jgi:hypothetical protein